MKNMVMMAMRVGNRPLQGTKLLVMMAISRSRGESMIRQPTTPAALQPKPIAHGEGLFAAGTGLFKILVEIEGHPRQITEVLQQGKQREEDRHGGQHHRHHPRQHTVDPQHQRAVEPFRSVQGGEQVGQPVLDPEQAVRQKLRRHVRPVDGQPEDHA